MENKISPRKEIKIPFCIKVGPKNIAVGTRDVSLAPTNCAMTSVTTSNSMISVLFSVLQ